ncbi:MAG TPA: universal stress protein, partial [Geminicoccaceae bacterium]
MIKRILVGVSGAPDTEAKVAWTLDLATRHGASVTVLSVVDRERLLNVGPVPLGAGYYAERLGHDRVHRGLAAAEQAVEQVRAACSGAGVPVEVLRQEGDPFDHLLRAWRYADLCVLGAKGWFDHDLIPEPEHALLRLIARGMRPLLAVPGTTRPVNKVLIAYNGSLESAKAMKQFLQAPLWQGQETHLACIGAPKSGEDAQLLLFDATDYARSHGVEPHVANPPPGESAWQTLLDHAGEIGADAIVLGSSYRRMLISQRFGRNAINLLR